MTEAQTAKLEQLIQDVAMRVEDAERDVFSALSDLNYVLDRFTRSTTDVVAYATKLDAANARLNAESAKLRALQLVRDAD